MTHMKTYLSIDLDYWLSEPYVEYTQSLTRVLKSVRHVQDIIIVEDHHEILDHVNRLVPDKILHIDYHQDIAFPRYAGDTVDLQCGTFLYFVENRERIDFEWWYPRKECAERSGTGWCCDYKHPRSNKARIFATQRQRLGLPTSAELARVSAVGFSISRDWCNEFVDTVLSSLGSVHPAFITYSGGKHV